MILPTSITLRAAAVACRVPSSCSRPTISPPRAFVKSSWPTIKSPRECTASIVRRKIFSKTIRTSSRFVTLLESHDARRNLSTAAITAHEDEVILFDHHPSPTIDGYLGGGERMPRLHALRERLRQEKHSGDRHGDTLRNDQSSNAYLDNNWTTPAHPISLDEAVDYGTANISSILTDSHGRHHNYLRLSLSERCNLRCQYCMPPEGVPLSPSSKLLSDDEIIRLLRVFVKNGVNKVRLTGGEPLLRPNLASLVRSISDVLRNSDNEGRLVGMTTNGISLSRHIDDLVDAGLTGVNISLDTLNADRFLEITRRNGLDKVMRAIGDCVTAFRTRYGTVRVGTDGSGGSRVKINCVVMRGINDDELSDFVRMAYTRFNGDVDIRFIEWMPFNDNGWNSSRFISYKDMLDKISHLGMPLERIGDGPNDTTKWWRVQQRVITDNNCTTRIGFITSMSEHFCSSCNRLRITADGKIKVCLFGSNETEVSLRDIMRKYQHEDLHLQEKALGEVIYMAVQRKTFALGGHGSAENIAKAADNRPMTLIGG